MHAEQLPHDAAGRCSRGDAHAEPVDDARPGCSRRPRGSKGRASRAAGDERRKWHRRVRACATVPHEQGSHSSAQTCRCVELHSYSRRARVDRVAAVCAHCVWYRYLTSQTWTRGAESAALAAEITQAMDLGVHVLLAHEMAGVGGQENRSDRSSGHRRRSMLFGWGGERCAMRVPRMGSPLGTVCKHVRGIARQGDARARPRATRGAESVV